MARKYPFWLLVALLIPTGIFISGCPSKNGPTAPSGNSSNNQPDTPTSTPTSTSNGPTSTPSSTASSTATHTPGNTATLTPTSSATVSPTNTASGTPTNTVVNTATSTTTSSSTRTATFSPTNTASATSTNTLASTATNTTTSTVTNTTTSTATQTASGTPTSTGVASATSTTTSTTTDTPSATASSTTTDSPTASPTASPTNTTTGTATLTPSFTPSFTPSGTPTDSATSTVSSTPTLTPTSTPLSVLIVQPTEPASASYLPGTAGVTAIVVDLNNTGNAPATLNSLVFAVPGTGNTQATAGLYNSNLILIGSGAFLTGTSAVTISSGSFLDVLPANSSETYTLIFNFTGSGTGSITPSLLTAGVSVTAAAGANVSGSATGPTVTIANPSPTPTNTPSFTPSSTPTLTATSTPTATTTNSATSTVTDTATITMTPTSTPANVFIAPFNEPASSSFVPGTIGVTLMSMTLTNAGTNLATLDSMAISVTGTGNDFADISTLALFKNSSPVTFSKASFAGSGATAVTFQNGSSFDTIPIGSAVTYTLTVDYYGSALGTYTASVTDAGVSVTNGSGVVVTGGVTGPTISIALATSTPTNTATDTATSTPTDTTTSTATQTPTYTPTSTPTNEVVSIVQPTEPPSGSFLIGSTGVTVLLANVSNPGVLPVTLSSMAVSLTESGSPWIDINKVWLYRNSNPSPLAVASFQIGASAVTFSGVPFDSLAAGGAVSYTLTYDFANTASGSFTTSIIAQQLQGGVATGGTININGSATGPTLTLGTATPTFTITPSFTPTSTATVTPTATSPFNVPDPNLRLGILMSLHSPTPTSGTPADIPLSVLQAAVSINADNLGVTSIFGLQNCQQLTVLSIQGDPVTDISPLAALASFHNLFSLHMDYDDVLNNLTPLANLTSLQFLEMRGGTSANPFGTPGSITSLAPLANLTGLQELEVSNQPITSVAPLANLTALNALFLIGCQPTSGFTGGVGVLGNLTNLQTLYVSNDNVTDISALSTLVNVQTADLANNPNLTNISALAGWKNAQNVILEYTGITAIPALGQLGFSNSPTSPLALDIANNPLTDISGLSTTTVPGFNINGSTLNITNDNFTGVTIQKANIQSRYTTHLTITGP